MNRIFAKFVDHLLESPDIPALHTALEAVEGALGLHAFAYLSPHRAPPRVKDRASRIADRDAVTWIGFLGAGSGPTGSGKNARECGHSIR